MVLLGNSFLWKFIIGVSLPLMLDDPTRVDWDGLNGSPVMVLDGSLHSPTLDSPEKLSPKFTASPT